MKNYDSNEKPIKVLFILNSSAGGASQGIYELLRSIPKNKISGYLIVPDKPPKSKVDLLQEIALDWRTITMPWWNEKTSSSFYHRLLVGFKNNVKSLFRLKPMLGVLGLIKQWEIDIVYTATSLNLEGALAAKMAKVPHIWHLKETFGEQGRVSFPISNYRFSKLIITKSKAVITMTEYIKSFIDPAFQNESKIHVLHDGVKISCFNNPEPGNLLRGKLQLNQSDILVAMVASLSSAWKNHRLFIEMAGWLHRRNSKVKYALFGSIPRKHAKPYYNAPWDYYQELLGQIRDSPAKDQFIHVGFHSNIPALMGAIDILVHPCAIEPFGRISIEAQASGTVVVGPNSGGIAESVVNDVTGFLVEPNDPIAFGNAVLRLVSNIKLKEQMGENGKKHVSDTFSQEDHNSKIMDIFIEALQH